MIQWRKYEPSGKYGDSDNDRLTPSYNPRTLHGREHQTRTLLPLGLLVLPLLLLAPTNLADEKPIPPATYAKTRILLVYLGQADNKYYFEPMLAPQITGNIIDKPGFKMGMRPKQTIICRPFTLNKGVVRLDGKEGPTLIHVPAFDCETFVLELTGIAWR